MEIIFGFIFIIAGSFMIYADIKTFIEIGWAPVAGLFASIGLFTAFIGVCALFSKL